MQATDRNRTIALAALFQSIDAVNQIAAKGAVSDEQFKTSINSIVTQNSETIEDIYGGLENLEKGFKILMFQLGSGRNTPSGDTKDLETTRYGINLLYLEKKLSRNEEIFKKLLDGIAAVQKKLEFFDDIAHESVIAKLADVYTETISKVGPKIMVKGKPDELSKPENAAKIRALLLAGIRASLLWRQAGGTRWKLLFGRGKMQKEANNLLREIAAQSV